MKVTGFLSILSLLTFFSLLYVYQQTEIFSQAYVGQKRQSVFEDLLDKNSILRYNVKKSASLVRIGNRIPDYADFQMPESYRLVRLATAEGNLRGSTVALNRENVLSRLFGIKRQAEAKTINTSTTLSVDGELNRTTNP